MEFVSFFVFFCVFFGFFFTSQCSIYYSFESGYSWQAGLIRQGVNGVGDWPTMHASVPMVVRELRFLFSSPFLHRAVITKETRQDALHFRIPLCVPFSLVFSFYLYVQGPPAYQRIIAQCKPRTSEPSITLVCKDLANFCVKMGFIIMLQRMNSRQSLSSGVRVWFVYSLFVAAQKVRLRFLRVAYLSAILPSQCWVLHHRFLQHFFAHFSLLRKPTTLPFRPSVHSVRLPNDRACQRTQEPPVHRTGPGTENFTFFCVQDLLSIFLTFFGLSIEAKIYQTQFPKMTVPWWGIKRGPTVAPCGTALGRWWRTRLGDWHQTRDTVVFFIPFSFFGCLFVSEPPPWPPLFHFCFNPGWNHNPLHRSHSDLNHLNPILSPSHGFARDPHPRLFVVSSLSQIQMPNVTQSTP